MRLLNLFSVQGMLKEDQILGSLPESRVAYKNFYKIAWPSALEALLVAMIGVIDTIMVGSLGTGAIAAVGITIQPKFILLAVIFSLNIGITAVTARRKGQGNQKAANKTVRAGIIISAAVSVLMSLLGFLFARQILTVAGADASYLSDAVLFFRVLMLSIPFQSLNLTINAAHRGCGKTKISMTTNIISNIINIIFDYLLINGIGFFPKLGVAGAAIATTLGAFAAFLISLNTLFRKDGYLSFYQKAGWPLHIKRKKTHLTERKKLNPTENNVSSLTENKGSHSIESKESYLAKSEESYLAENKESYLTDVIRPIMKVSSSAFVEQVFMRIGFFAYAAIIARLGTLEYETHVICMNILTLSFCFGDGLSIAASALVGQNLGAKRPDISIIYGKTGQRLAFLISCIIFLVFIFGRSFLVSLFTQEADIISLGAGIMILAALGTHLQTSQVVLTGCLRGAGDTAYVAVVSFLSVALVRPMLTWFLCYPAGFGLYGAWIALLIDQCFRFITSYQRFSGGRWAKIAL